MAIHFDSVLLSLLALGKLEYWIVTCQWRRDGLMRNFSFCHLAIFDITSYSSSRFLCSTMCWSYHSGWRLNLHNNLFRKYLFFNMLLLQVLILNDKRPYVHADRHNHGFVLCVCCHLEVLLRVRWQNKNGQRVQVNILQICIVTYTHAKFISFLC